MAEDKKHDVKNYEFGYDIPEGMSGEEFLSNMITKSPIYEWISKGGEGSAGDPGSKKIIDEIISNYGKVIDIIRDSIKTPQDVRNLMEALKTSQGPPSASMVADILEKSNAESS